MPWASKQLLFLVAGFALNLMLFVHSQDDQSGFISIDCGLQADRSYSEPDTGINYISDATFIDTGESKSTSPSYRNEYQQQYGRETAVPTHKELIYVPLRNYIHVCLVNTGSGVPFISSLGLRPLPNASYETTTGSLALVSRYDTGETPDGAGYRYPDDILDRYWDHYDDPDDWTQLNTSSTIKSESDDPYQLPSVVMTTASTPKNPSDSLSIVLSLPDKDAEYYSYLHFAEVESLQLNQSRFQYVFGDVAGNYGPFAPQYLSRDTISDTNAWSSKYFNVSITGAENSTLPPILNAFEIYMVNTS
ncbi:hypothetical protein ACE6H2_009955 [Prunus campanulata]